MSYERAASGGLGWSEQEWWRPRVGLCSGTDFSRKICFIDSDPVEQRTAERSGCVRARGQWYQRGSITECRTNPGNNPGHLWCCPDNAPVPIPTTPQQRARDTELLLAEEQAQREGRLPEAGAAVPEETSKNPPLEPGQTEPVSQQELVSSTLSKLGRQQSWIVPVALVGLVGAFGYWYYTKQRRRAKIRRYRAAAAEAE